MVPVVDALQVGMYPYIIMYIALGVAEDVADGLALGGEHLIDAPVVAKGHELVL